LCYKWGIFRDWIVKEAIRFRDLNFVPTIPRFIIARLSPFDLGVVDVVRSITDTRRGAYDRVFPHDVVVYAPAEVSIRHMRRIMVRLEDVGLLRRVSKRGGYRLVA
jgi:hypothetical protein